MKNMKMIFILLGLSMILTACSNADENVFQDNNLSEESTVSEAAENEENTESAENTEHTQSDATLQEVMDRILSEIGLEGALPYDSLDEPSGDKIYLDCSTSDDVYTIYRFYSEEYGCNGMLLNYKIDGEDNWNYLYEDWIPGYEQPVLREISDNQLLFTYCWSGGTGVHMDRLIYFETHSTGTVEYYILTDESIMEQVDTLVRCELDEENNEVQVYSTEKGSDNLIALIPYEDWLVEGNTIKGASCYLEQQQYLLDPPMLLLGVGMSVDDSVLPVYVGQLAFQIDVESDGTGHVEIKLSNPSIYNVGGIENLE